MAFYPPFNQEKDLPGYRPYLEIPQVSNLWVDSEQGSDDSGDGSQSNPYQTIKKAYLQTGMGDTSNTNINLVYRSTAYDLDFGIFGANFIDIRGQTDIEETRNITSVNYASADRGMSITVDGATLSNNAWKGRILYIDGALGNLRQFIVSKNVGNVLYGAMSRRTGFFDSTQINFATAGTTANLMRFPEISIVGANFVIGSIQFDIFYCKITGGQIFLPATGKVGVYYSEVANATINTSRGGAIYILSSAINMKGASPTNPIPSLKGAANGEIRIGHGSVMTDLNDNSAIGQWIEVRNSASLNLVGGVLFAGISGNGIVCNGGSIFETSPNIATDLNIIFDDENSDITNTKGFIFNNYEPTTFDSPDSIGGFSSIPECHGSISADYLVEAQRGAYVEIASGSSVTTNLGTNTVSSDGGTTNNWSNADGTRVIGGSPSNDFFNHVDIANGALGNGSSAPTQTIYNNFTAWRYALNDDSVITIELPHDLDATQDISMHIVWAINEAFATNSGEVQWQMDWSIIDAFGGDVVTSPPATGTVKTGDIDIPAVANTVVHTTNLTISASNFSSKNILGAKISRVALDGGSNPTANPQVISMHLEYKRLY